MIRTYLLFPYTFRFAMAVKWSYREDYWRMQEDQVGGSNLVNVDERWLN